MRTWTYVQLITIASLHALSEAVKENFSVFKTVCNFFKCQVILRAETLYKVYVAEGEIQGDLSSAYILDSASLYSLEQRQRTSE